MVKMEQLMHTFVHSICLTRMINYLHYTTHLIVGRNTLAHSGLEEMLRIREARAPKGKVCVIV